MTCQEREPGFYWVKYADEWAVAEYYPRCFEWYLTGSSCMLEDSDLEAIGPRIEKPEECQ